jgi:hypothetical protein
VNSEIWPTCWWDEYYGESPIPCEIKKGKLRIFIEYSAFEWLEGDSPDEDIEEPDGEPHGIRATSTDGYTIDFTVMSPAALLLLKLGLVNGAPDYAIRQATQRITAAANEKDKS